MKILLILFGSIPSFAIAGTVGGGGGGELTKAFAKGLDEALSSPEAKAAFGYQGVEFLRGKRIFVFPVEEFRKENGELVGEASRGLTAYADRLVGDLKVFGRPEITAADFDGFVQLRLRSSHEEAAIRANRYEVDLSWQGKVERNLVTLADCLHELLRIVTLRVGDAFDDSRFQVSYGKLKLDRPIGSSSPQSVTVESSPSCTEPLNELKTLVKVCGSTLLEFTCLREQWPWFKQSYPVCVMAGMPFYLETCQSMYPGATCTHLYAQDLKYPVNSIY